MTKGKAMLRTLPLLLSLLLLLLPSAVRAADDEGVGGGNETATATPSTARCSVRLLRGVGDLGASHATIVWLYGSMYPPGGAVSDADVSCEPKRHFISAPKLRKP